jgi:serum/glucocorticoid-regulated kinase 2
LIVRKTKQQSFVLSSEDGDLSLDYYLTMPAAKLNIFLGKTIKLRGYMLAHQRMVDIKSFDVVRAIGSGGFSKVFLVRFKGDGQFYAMKVISKSFILKQKKKQLVVNERNIMVDITHPLHAKLQWAFESKHSIIFVMDYYPGG